jgi:hypothetical protein
MRVLEGLALSAAVTLVATGAGVAVASGPRPAVSVGHVAVVQAVPGTVVDVRIDGQPVGNDVATGKVLGPYELSTGEHRIDFTSPTGLAQAATVRVAGDSHQDVVLHLGAAPGSVARVTTYRIPVDPIGPEKARVLVAHAASVGAADLRVDGQAVFTDVTNGEFATADVPAGRHSVVLVPADAGGPHLLGPLDLALSQRTITMLYAIGDPEAGLTAVVHTARLAGDGTLVPTTIGTGSAGLASDIRVQQFG